MSVRVDAGRHIASHCSQNSGWSACRLIPAVGGRRVAAWALWRFGQRFVVVVAFGSLPMLAAAHPRFDFVLAEYANTVIWRSHDAPCSDWRLTGLGAPRAIMARDSAGCVDSYASGSNERFCIATIVGEPVRVTFGTPHEHTKTRGGRTLSKAPASGADLCATAPPPTPNNRQGREAGDPPTEAPSPVNEQTNPRPPQAESRRFVPSSWRNALSALRRRQES